MLWTKRINKPGSNPLTFEEARVGGDYLIMTRGEYENLMEEMLDIDLTPPERHPFRDPDIESDGPLLYFKKL